MNINNGSSVFVAKIRNSADETRSDSGKIKLGVKSILLGAKSILLKSTENYVPYFPVPDNSWLAVKLLHHHDSTILTRHHQKAHRAVSVMLLLADASAADAVLGAPCGSSGWERITVRDRCRAHSHQSGVHGGSGSSHGGSGFDCDCLWENFRME